MDTRNDDTSESYIHPSVFARRARKRIEETCPTDVGGPLRCRNEKNRRRWLVAGRRALPSIEITDVLNSITTMIICADIIFIPCT